MTNEVLIEEAKTVLRPVVESDGHTRGDVACALITNGGNLYRGVCIDTISGMGFCAEANAIGAMLTAGESKIQQIVAVVSRDGASFAVLSPCGRCREFMAQVDPANLETDIVLDTEHTMKLKELLPYQDWKKSVR
jgi:cytidine deaminase